MIQLLGRDWNIMNYPLVVQMPVNPFSCLKVFLNKIIIKRIYEFVDKLKHSERLRVSFIPIDSNCESASALVRPRISGELLAGTTPSPSSISSSSLNHISSSSSNWRGSLRYRLLRSNAGTLSTPPTLSLDLSWFCSYLSLRALNV